MSAFQSLARKLALGLFSMIVVTAAHALPFRVGIFFYGEEAPPPAAVRLALDLIDADGLSNSSVKIWSQLPVSRLAGSVTTVGATSEYRLDDSMGTSSLEFATRNSGIFFDLDWADIARPADPGTQFLDRLTLRLLDERGQPFLPTSDPSGTNILAIFSANGMRSFSTQYVEIDAQLPASPTPVPVPEPDAMGLIALGMAGLILVARRRRRSH